MEGAIVAAPAASSAAGRPRTPLPERLARVVVVAATLWFTLALSWGLFGRVGAGHDAVVASRAIVAENMLRWHIAAPVRDFTLGRPTPDVYYTHHPFGSFWTIALFAAALGSHAYVPRLVAVLTSAAAPPLLYGIGASLWGPVPGALAALAYTTLPMTLAFGNFPGFEGPIVTACLLATWGYVRYAQTGRGRWCAVSLAGVLWAVQSDWEAYVFVAAVVAMAGAGALFAPRPWLARGDARRFARWAALATAVACVSLLGYFAFLQSVDAVGHLLDQEVKRSRGNGLPLLHVLRERSYWIDVTFTPVAVLAGKVALPLFLLRVLVFRRWLEVFPLAILAMALVQYVNFKNGADVHIYWPYPFAPYYALSIGVLADTACVLGRAALAFFDVRSSRSIVPLAVLGVVGLVPLGVLPDGIEGLVYARTSGGRFNERGKATYREIDKAQALEWMAARMPQWSTVAVHEGMHATWAEGWALHRPIEIVTSVPTERTTGDQRYFVADLAFLSAADQLKLAQSFAVLAVGRYVFVDRGAPPGPAQGYVFDEREPKPWEWYLISGVDPVRTIRPDAFYTWELRESYGQLPNPPPPGRPASREQLRIAHNVAVASGDLEAAARDEQKLLAGLDTREATTFTNGVRLLGEEYVPGVAPKLVLYFVAGGPTPVDDEFDVSSVVDRRRTWSLVPADDRVKQLGTPFTLPTRLWRKGFLYAQQNELRHRPGHEIFFGDFQARPDETTPRPVDGSPRVELRVP